MNGNGWSFGSAAQGMRPRLHGLCAAAATRSSRGVGSSATARGAGFEQRLAALRALAIFRDCTSGALVDLAEASSLRRFSRSRRLAYSGSQDDCAILVQGRAKMCIPRGRADGELVLEVFRDGDVISESCWIRRDRLFAGETVALETCSVLFIPRLAIEKLVDGDTEVAIALLERVADRLARTSTLAAQNACMAATDRLYCRLVELSLSRGTTTDEGLLVDHGLSQRELAAFAAASREIVNRVLAGWRERGWIEIRRRTLLIRDVAALTHAVSPDARRVGFGAGDGRSPTRRS